MDTEPWLGQCSGMTPERGLRCEIYICEDSAGAVAFTTRSGEAG
jgi:hypothetical protein